MTQEEVRLIVKGWLDTQSKLVLVGNVFRIAVALRCRVSGVSDFWVELSTTDNGKLGVALFDPEADFKYSEPREFAGLSAKLGLSEQQNFASSVTVLFPSKDESSEPESLMFIELVE